MQNKLITLSLGITLLFSSTTGFSQNQTKENSMEQYTVIQKPSLTLMGIKCKTSNAPGAGSKDIPELWGKFYAENAIEKIPNKTSNEVLALYCEYEGDFTKPYSLIIGCPVSSTDTVPEGMVVKTIPAASYALFQAIGEHPKSLIETWGKIWQTNLKRTYGGDLEVYGDKPQTVEVLIAIE